MSTTEARGVPDRPPDRLMSCRTTPRGRGSHTANYCALVSKFSRGPPPAGSHAHQGTQNPLDDGPGGVRTLRRRAGGDRRGFVAPVRHVAPHRRCKRLVHAAPTSRTRGIGRRPTSSTSSPVAPAASATTSRSSTSSTSTRSTRTVRAASRRRRARQRIDWLGGLMTGYGNRPYTGHTAFVRLLYRF